MKDEFGITLSHSGDSRKERRRVEAVSRRCYRDKATGKIHLGNRAKSRQRLQEVSQGKPIVSSHRKQVVAISKNVM